jgi:hypothetical protein
MRGARAPSPRLFASCVVIAGLAAAVLGCGLLFPTVASDVPGSGGDAAEDGASGIDDGGSGDVGVPAKDFAIGVSPAYVAIAPGQSVPVTVIVQRFGAFEGEVDITLNLPSYVNPPSISTFISGTSTTLSLTSQVAAPPALAQANALGDFPLTVQGKTPSGSEIATTPLTVHLSGELAAFAAPGTTPFPVPSNVPLLRVKAWGAGGGSGSSGAYNGGGPGGAGGFVQADVVVVPGETLGVHVGASVVNQCSPQSGGGEGSAVLRGATMLAVAGGGGGGGQGCAGVGGWGGGGGGNKGGNGAGGQCGGDGGGGATQTGDGTSAAGCGAGGGGLHNGGLGATGNNNQCSTSCGESGGNGGGSGGSEALDAGVTVTANAAAAQYSPSPPNSSDPDYAPDAGAGAGTVPTPGQGHPGNAGRIVILVP